MSEPRSTTCTRLSQIMGISHDSVNRFLLRESYEPKDLFNEAQTVKNHRMGLMFAVEANHTVSVEKGTWVHVQRLDVPAEGRMV
jgi:hypothetical protein